jgi:hypothetical protein
MAATAINHLVAPLLRSNNQDSSNNNNQHHHWQQSSSEPHRVSISEIARTTDFGHSTKLTPDDFTLVKTLGTCV